MTLALPDRAIAGAFAGLDSDGGLCLRVGAETLVFAVGELQLEAARLEKARVENSGPGA